MRNRDKPSVERNKIWKELKEVFHKKNTGRVLIFIYFCIDLILVDKTSPELPHLYFSTISMIVSLACFEKKKVNLFLLKKCLYFQRLCRFVL